ncbi:hypothetical protein [Celeribacter indicus]|uniref:Lipoprotein n=1 Tax=Celeribacter indicus TaxID=1208324 RepID=A0A0B5DT82_9RHOB|nr:hypothetical protein [Celeribacter indicus]AJE46648.1 hypothetical protein P73_1933 [Celeribacter indicus]SDX56430.1 hypothetical protein SAMN05443573_1431 [Celeribacter indicus]
MMSNAGCWKPPLAALAIATSLLSGCATVGSETGEFGTCPPVVEYSWEFQARAAEELASLQLGPAVGEMLSDHAVMRDQARTCLRP